MDTQPPDTHAVWQYKTYLTNDLSETTLVDGLNHEGSDGWELVTIQAITQQAPQEEGTLPGVVNQTSTGSYLVVLKKLQDSR